jgi:predicted ATPase/DNA-binding SARP family transcriptional activator
VADLEFRILGMVEVLRGGAHVAIRRGSTLNLLAGLLVSANAAVGVDALAELAWGDAPPSNTRPALQNKIWRLRRLLGEEAIESVSDGYRLRVGTGQLDLLRFESLVSKAREVATDEETAASLTEAIALWRGRPLGGVESAVSAEMTERLTERYLVVCEQWTQVALRLGRNAAVVDRITPLVAAHPFRESLVGQLILALYRDGRQADALAAYSQLRQALRDELGVDPSAALQDLYIKIIRAEPDEPARPAGRQRPNQASWIGRRPPPGGLIGRDTDVAALAKAVHTNPAVTVIGPAGVGKTALAMETARQIAGEFADGVVVVELGTLPAQQSGDITAVAGMVLAMIEPPGAPAESTERAVIQELQERESLIVLDNAEHVSVACASLVDIVAASCPRTRVIVTSRRPLGRGSERLADLATLSPSAAAELLRLRMADCGIDPAQEADPADVAELCRLIEGLPLAVELAAARLRTMSVRALLDRITARPDLLTVEGRPGLAHQRGLISTLQWSYDLLTAHRRLLLGRLAVFASTFSLDCAEYVGGYPPLAADDVAGLLSGLADDSLVQVTRDRGDQCYRLLVPVRDFALSRADDGDLEAARSQHLRLLCDTAGRIEGASGGLRDSLVARLREGFPEILAALEFAFRSAAAEADVHLGAQLLLTTQPVWERRPGATPAILYHAIRILERPAAVPERLMADLTLLTGGLQFRAGNLAEAKGFLERARDLLNRPDPASRRKRAEVLSYLAAGAYARLEPGAVDLIRDATDAARETGEPGTIAFRLSVAAVMLVALGELDEAVGLIDEAGTAARGQRALRQRYLTRRAEVYLRAHRVSEALADARQVLSDRSGATSYDLVSSLLSHGIAQRLQGDADGARATLEEGLRLAREAQVTTLLPELTQALAHTEFTTANVQQAILNVRKVLHWTLPNLDLIDTISALHLAVAIAVVTNHPHAAALAAAVRDCRLRGKLTTWPFTEREYAEYEEAAHLGEPADPGKPLSHDAIIHAGELVLTHLHTEDHSAQTQPHPEA